MPRTTPCTLLGVLCLLVSTANGMADDSADLTISSQECSVTLSVAAKGAVISLVNKRTGREMIAKQESPELFLLRFSQRDKRPSKTFYLSSRNARSVHVRQEKSDGEVTGFIEFSEIDGRPIHVECTVTATPNDRFLRWRLRASFPDNLMLQSVRFPMIVFKTPLGGEATDAFVAGATKGGLYPAPSKWKSGRRVAFRQPGSMAAQFACYYDTDGGVQTMALDAQGTPKTLSATRTAEGLAIAWTRPCYQASDFKQTYDIGVTTFQAVGDNTSTDWRDAADIYKRWAVQQAWCRRTLKQRDDLPTWLREGPAMVRFNRTWLRRPPTIESWLTEYWKKQFPDNTPLVIAYWGWEKVDTWITPDYFPVYPSDAEFRHLTAVGRTIGGHSFLWPSGYHYTLTYKKQPNGHFAWDDRERFDAVARSHAICDRDGQVILRKPSWLRGGQTATMCPGDPWTIDWLNRAAIEMARRGVELVQIDQVVGGAFPDCYSLKHGHFPGSGIWKTEVFRKQLQSMLAACRKLQPDAVVCFEEPNEHFIQQVGIQDYRDWEVMRRSNVEPASVFNYLYHEYLPTFQSNPRRGDTLMAAHCLVTGQIPHLVPSARIGPSALLENGTFEEWVGSAPTGWTKVSGYQGRLYDGDAIHDRSHQHSGQYSLRLENTQPKQIVQVSQNIHVGNTFHPGQAYRMSAWLKSDGTTQPNALLVGAFTSDMKHLKSWRIAVPQSKSEWVEGRIDFKLPEGTQLLRIMLHITGPARIWIDDMALLKTHVDGPAVEVPCPDAPSDHALMHAWVRLFHGEGRPYLLHGTMLHPPPLKTSKQAVTGRSFPTILHNAFRASDGSRATVLVNWTTSPQTGQLDWNGKKVTITLKPQEIKLLRE